MHALRLRCRAEEKDGWIAELWSRGTEGITEREQPDGSWELDAFFSVAFESPVGEWIEVDERDWAESWKDAWEPIAVGQRWFLVPDWRDDAAPEGRVRLVVHARQASGSGYQPATQLALEAMEDHVRAGDSVFDWGVGSGILCAAARLLGAGRITGCDVDASALAEARENLALDPVALFRGSGRSMRTGAFDVVVANVNAATILESAVELARIVRLCGVLILSGFKVRRVESVESALAALGLATVRRYQREHWHCLVMRQSRP